MSQLKIAKPFLKWAGGKKQLLPELRKNYPSELIEGQIDTYIEPFLGGGAVLFDILNTYDVKNVTASDINRDLIITYKVVQNNIDELIALLQSMQDEYYSLNEEGRKNYYYLKRNMYNLYKKNDLNPEKDTLTYQHIFLASLLIFLNRTCFNGLYRVNSKGEFNVPIGRYKNPLICDEENLKNVSELVQNVKFTCRTYEEISINATDKTFIYVDPPYRALPKTPSFISYFNSEFGEQSQIDLAKWLTNISSENTFILTSNSDPHNTNEQDNFFEDNYQTFTLKKVLAKRNINSKGEKRGQITELLIKNY